MARGVGCSYSKGSHRRTRVCALTYTILLFYFTHNVLSAPRFSFQYASSWSLLANKFNPSDSSSSMVRLVFFLFWPKLTGIKQ